MYGSLTSMVLVMLWLYLCICILFLGAEINESLMQQSSGQISGFLYTEPLYSRLFRPPLRNASPIPVSGFSAGTTEEKVQKQNIASLLIQFKYLL